MTSDKHNSETRRVSMWLFGTDLDAQKRRLEDPHSLEVSIRLTNASGECKSASFYDADHMRKRLPAVIKAGWAVKSAYRDSINPAPIGSGPTSNDITLAVQEFVNSIE